MSGHSTGESGSVVLDTRRRRTREEREAIVAELKVPGVKVSAVARRHGLSPSLLFRWRREAAVQAGRLVARTEGFLPVLVAAGGSPSTPKAGSGIIEIELSGGVRIRVDASFDATALARAIDILARR
jgi:transposase